MATNSSSQTPIGEPILTGSHWVWPDGNKVLAIMGGDDTPTPEPPKPDTTPPPAPKMVPESDLLAVKSRLETTAQELNTTKATVSELNKLVESERTTKAELEKQLEATKPNLEKVTKLETDLLAAQKTLEIFSSTATESRAKLLMVTYGVTEAVLRTDDGKAWLPADQLDIVERTLKRSSNNRATPKPPGFDAGSRGIAPTGYPQSSGISKIREGIKELG